MNLLSEGGSGTFIETKKDNSDCRMFPLAQWFSNSLLPVLLYIFLSHWRSQRAVVYVVASTGGYCVEIKTILKTFFINSSKNNNTFITC